MELIGKTETVSVQRLSNGVLIFLPLCPSTNARMRPVRMGAHCREILTAEARDYIAYVGMALRVLMRQEHLKPISSYSYVDLWFILPRTNCDAHNFGKILFDAMEAGGLVTNDKFILPRVMGVYHDVNSQVVAKIYNGLSR